MVFDFHRFELPMKHVAEATGFIATDHAIGSLLQLSRLPQERFGRELLRGLRCFTFNLLHNDVLALVDVDSKLDDLRFRFSLFT